ncbi:hypothetical protein ELQ35_10540 [Peribacillus cavernae]|uniref:Uncharacterized protein n=1 Tax=Peribacillus cavernae TaxID=1674310 RepID=A0A433HLV8_9BACI|nr:hypothetical protein [Peribacillus cavernae]MDQ0218892.1 ribosome maturation factor RimP [Peribacillus cavernae]RUQ29386.1 hypothetical protein ELQ35_10540 [Peribacillus cavernae]
MDKNKKAENYLSKKEQMKSSAQDDQPCSPNCPEIIETPRFSSPNSSLSEKKLKELEECISKANDLLRSIGNESDPDNLRQLQLHFRSLRGVKVKVDVINNEKKIQIKGEVEEAGKDFIQLGKRGQTIFILFERIRTIDQAEPANVREEQELRNIDKSAQSYITFKFGHAVSANPYLLNLFFGIPLFVQLVPKLGSRVIVKAEGEKRIKGRLISTEKGHMQLEIKKGKTKQINLAKLYTLTFLKG